MPMGPKLEELYWCVVNIPSGDISQGDTLVSHLAPAPRLGIGLGKEAVVLLKQQDVLQAKDLDVRGRSVSLYDMIQDNNLTPVHSQLCTYFQILRPSWRVYYMSDEEPPKVRKYVCIFLVMAVLAYKLVDKRGQTQTNGFLKL